MTLFLSSTTFWTPLKDQEAHRLWRAGFSASQVASAIGAVSGHAVLGRVRRRGWGRSIEIARQNHRAAHPVYSFRTLPLPADPPVAIAASPRPWLEREAGQCAFPVDGESCDTRSCCNPCGAATYCEAHAAIMRGPSAPDGEDLARNLAWLLA